MSRGTNEHRWPKQKETKGEDNRGQGTKLIHRCKNRDKIQEKNAGRTSKGREKKRTEQKTKEKKEKKREREGARKRNRTRTEREWEDPENTKKGRRQTKNEIGHRLARSSPSSSSPVFCTRWAFLLLLTILIALLLCGACMKCFTRAPFCRQPVTGGPACTGWAGPGPKK